MFSAPQAPLRPDDDLSRRLNSNPGQVPPLPPPASAAPPARGNEPGDFTKMFAAPQRPAGPPAYGGGDADYTDKLYQRPAAPGMPVPAPAPPPPPPSGSEFTRAMQRVDFTEPAPAAAAQKPPEAAPPVKPSRLPLVIVVVGIVVVLVIALVLLVSLSSI